MRQAGQKDLITVIMPCYNAAAFIRQAVESALGQSYPDVELVVVDDGSSDESMAILEELKSQYAGRIWVYRQQNKGPYPARNLGLSNARGEYVAFLDADDYWDPWCLQKLYDALHRHAADISYCGWQNVHEVGSDREPYIPPPYEEQDIVAAFLKGCPWPIHAALVRRALIDAAGGFSERIYTSMDYDLWLRMSALSPNILRVPEVLAYYRWHDKGQISGVKWRQVLNSRRVKLDFICANPSLVSHLPREVLRELTDGQVLKHAYMAYWRRDLVSAQRLFRVSMRNLCWSVKDLRYLLPSLLPGSVYRAMIHYVDARQAPSVGT